MPSSPPQPGLIGLHGLAVALGLPRDWLRAEALAGRMPCLKAGKRLLFNREAVERTLLKRAAVNTIQEGQPHAP